MMNREKYVWRCIKSKRVNIAVDPLLTNPLNSATKLQIGGTLQNYFSVLLINLTRLKELFIPAVINYKLLIINILIAFYREDTSLQC